MLKTYKRNRAIKTPKIKLATPKKSFILAVFL